MLCRCAEPHGNIAVTFSCLTSWGQSGRAHAASAAVAGHHDADLRRV